MTAALRIANHLEISASHAANIREKAAKELRRLYEENERLNESLLTIKRIAENNSFEMIQSIPTGENIEKEWRDVPVEKEE